MAVRKWMPAYTRELLFSSCAWDSVSKQRVEPAGAAVSVVMQNL